MTDEELSQAAQDAAEALWALEQANPAIDFSDLHKKCEKLFDGFVARSPGVIRPDGGGPK